VFDAPQTEGMIWDSEEVKIRITQLYRLGKDISYTGVWEEYPHLLFAAQHYFPNWGYVVTSCGIDYHKVRRHQAWSRKRVKKHLMTLKEKGEDLSYNQFEKNHLTLLHAAQYHFGSWETALSSIGIDYSKVRKLKNWSKEKIKSRIKNLKNKGIDLSFRAMFKQGYGVVVSMGCFYYGSWRRAIEKAGFDYTKIRKRQAWSKERVVTTIKQLYRQGVDLSYTRLREQGYGRLTSMGCYYFPNWGKAIEQSGLAYARVKKKPGPIKGYKKV